MHMPWDEFKKSSDILNINCVAALQVMLIYLELTSKHEEVLNDLHVLPCSDLVNYELLSPFL